MSLYHDETTIYTTKVTVHTGLCSIHHSPMFRFQRDQRIYMDCKSHFGFVKENGSSLATSRQHSVAEVEVNVAKYYVNDLCMLKCTLV